MRLQTRDGLTQRIVGGGNGVTGGPAGPARRNRLSRGLARRRPEGAAASPLTPWDRTTGPATGPGRAGSTHSTVPPAERLARFCRAFSAALAAWAFSAASSARRGWPDLAVGDAQIVEVLRAAADQYAVFQHAAGPRVIAAMGQQHAQFVRRHVVSRADEDGRLEEDDRLRLGGNDIGIRFAGHRSVQSCPAAKATEPDTSCPAARASWSWANVKYCFKARMACNWSVDAFTATGRPRCSRVPCGPRPPTRPLRGTLLSCGQTSAEPRYPDDRCATWPAS